MSENLFLALQKQSSSSEKIIQSTTQSSSSGATSKQISRQHRCSIEKLLRTEAHCYWSALFFVFNAATSSPMRQLQNMWQSFDICSLCGLHLVSTQKYQLSMTDLTFKIAWFWEWWLWSAPLVWCMDAKQPYRVFTGWSCRKGRKCQPRY